MSVVQPPLELELPQLLTHDGWVNHEGVAAAASALALWALQGGEVWLRSDSVAGKSHLLHALATELGDAHLLQIANGEQMAEAGQLTAGWLQQLQQGRWWIIDITAGSLSAERQLALFHIIERGRRDATPLVVGWRCDPAMITKAELLTRLRAMQQLQMQPPSRDEPLLAVLAAVATQMQWEVKREVLRYMLDHSKRDFTLLLLALRQLHQHSLQQQCRLSLVNIRELLSSQIVTIAPTDGCADRQRGDKR
ncbi:MAG: hypothetical protein Q9M13_01170 [Mariprofundales bacterium]|nr:hypothetical protein [Mariprofundales bacterium]